MATRLTSKLRPSERVGKLSSGLEGYNTVPDNQVPQRLKALLSLTFRL